MMNIEELARDVMKYMQNEGSMQMYQRDLCI